MYTEHLDDDAWISHCLLVMGENSDDGMLVESEGADYARYSAYQAGAKSYVREQICKVANEILYHEFGKQVNESWVVEWDSIKEGFGITINKTNGIGEMLVEELEKRNDVTEIAATEDGIEMSIVFAQDEKNNIMERDMLRTVNLIATYEELFDIPQEQRITHYYGDYGCYFLNSSVSEKNVKELVLAIERYIKLSQNEKIAMGLKGRKLVEENFDRQIVVDRYMEEIYIAEEIYRKEKRKGMGRENVKLKNS